MKQLDSAVTAEDVSNNKPVSRAVFVLTKHTYNKLGALLQGFTILQKYSRHMPVVKQYWSDTLYNVVRSNTELFIVYDGPN